MIFTLTLNPAVDRTIIVETLMIDHVNRIHSVRRDVGGKGLNVSKTLLALGTPSTALAVLAGSNGEYIYSRAQKMGLTLEAMWIEGNTRENLKIVDLINQTYTDLNEVGPSAEADTLSRICTYLDNTIGVGDIFVLSGSALPNMAPAIFQELLLLVQAKGAITILDVAGDALAQGIQAKPHMIKPNVHELESLMSRSLETLDQVAEAARALHQTHGVENIVVSMGEKGLIWVTGEATLHAPAIAVPVMSTVGAGDAIVAALAHGLSHQLTREQMLTSAIATATCVIQTEGSASGQLSNLDHYKSAVHIRTLP